MERTGLQDSILKLNSELKSTYLYNGDNNSIYLVESLWSLNNPFTWIRTAPGIKYMVVTVDTIVTGTIILFRTVRQKIMSGWKENKASKAL